ncbi:MAG: M23 family metallopeptidase [Sedimentibacter sp.]|uniref:M23 family metallopeptidase n=1 Tax=Sedimentibacter sp. TaxID=1960295 RepID=UPI0031581498
MIKLDHLPLSSLSVTSPYGLRNVTVGGTTYWWHNGVDFSAEVNTPVYAAAEGTVKAVRYNEGGYGYYAALDHGNFGTLYAHLSNLSVTEGDLVSAGDLIGYSGSTGAATGPHLHFELRIGSYDNFWDRARCDSNVFMRTSDPMVFIDEYLEKQKDISVETAVSIVKSRANLEDKTIDYMVNDYKFGTDLVKKLAKAIM